MIEHIESEYEQALENQRIIAEKFFLRSMENLNAKESNGVFTIKNDNGTFKYKFEGPVDITEENGTLLCIFKMTSQTPLKESSELFVILENKVALSKDHYELNRVPHDKEEPQQEFYLMLPSFEGLLFSEIPSEQTQPA